MANYEHGSREPDDVRVFDGGEDDDEGEGSNLPVVIVIAIVVLAALGGVVWLAYNNGVAHGRADAPRMAAANEAPAAAPGAGELPPKAIKVYQQPAPTGDEADQESTPPEQPAKSTVPPSQPAPAQPKPAPATPAPATTAHAAPPPVKVALAPVSTPKPAAEAPAALTPVKPAKQQPEVSAPATAPPKQLSLAVETKPAEPAAKPSEPPAKSAAPAVKPEESPVKVAAAAPKPVTVGAFVLQIGAYKSPADADTAWKSYHAKHATLLSGLSEDVQKADLGAKGTWYRLRVGSFADRNAAADLCEKLKAEGGTCFLAR